MGTGRALIPRPSGAPDASRGVFTTPGASSLPGLWSALKCSDVRRAFFYTRNEIIFSLLSGSCQKTRQIKGFEREGLGGRIRARGRFVGRRC